ncbi:hypothetical protein Micr_00212 [Candidatus Micrarchaeum sp.]|nr:hypothetical protein Micr_00212 [Candidatus Micrarchaeum sp.]
MQFAVLWRSFVSSFIGSDCIANNSMIKYTPLNHLAA